jgi:hypothetical protein
MSNISLCNIFELFKLPIAFHIEPKIFRNKHDDNIEKLAAAIRLGALCHAL